MFKILSIMPIKASKRKARQGSVQHLHNLPGTSSQSFGTESSGLIYEKISEITLQKVYNHSESRK